jgi:hypothetical protein
MKKQTAQKILSLIKKYKIRSDKIQELTDNLFDFIASSSYSPILDDNQLIPLFDGICVIHSEDIRDWLEYYVFEALNMENPIVKVKNKKYNFGKEKDFVRFLVENY